MLYTTRSGREKKLQGVLYYDSIYYWWYQYLRCSERYQYDSQNTVIVRLWKKAQKNIDAVERGEFGLGH